MKRFFIILALALPVPCISAQEKIKSNDANAPPGDKQEAALEKSGNKDSNDLQTPQNSPEKFSAIAAKRGVKTKPTDDSAFGVHPNGKALPYAASNKFNWKPAIAQSLIFLAMQHGFRMTEKKTRDELNGPFLRDWKRSVQNLGGWNDGGKDFTNYIAHPMQGAVTGRIFINNSDKARRQEFGKQGHYWESRVKTMAWSALWSLQFELGPISETSIGNVGKTRAGDGRSKQTYGDIVVTPLVGTGLVVLEDMVDKYVLDHWLEQRFTNSLMIKITRSLLTPSTSFGNILRGRAPWRRDYRAN